MLNAEVKPLGVKVTIVEPGGFRTDWGGSSMGTTTVGADYEVTVGAMNRFRESTVSTWWVTRSEQATSWWILSMWTSLRCGCYSAMVQ